MVDLALNNNIINYDEEDEALQELDILFNTYSTELIGDVTFGSNFEQFLWSLTPNEEEVVSYVYELFSNTTYVQKYISSVSAKYYDTRNGGVYVLSIMFTFPKKKKIIRKYHFK